MKTRALLIILIALTCQTLRAAPVKLEFSAVVTSSTQSAGLPGAGSTVQGHVLFDYDPATFISQSCGTDCANYLYLSPYEYFIDLGLSQITSSVVGIAVEDNTTVLDTSGPPQDLVEFGAKVQAVGYLLVLDGPPSSFAGTALPSQAALTSFWQSGFFQVTIHSFEQVLIATVTNVTLSPVPEPSETLLYLCGLAVVSARSRFRRGKT